MDYLRFAAIAVKEAEELILRDEIVYCVQLNKWLIKLLQKCVKDVLFKVGCGPKHGTPVDLQEEFYRIVKEAKNLVNACRNDTWLKTASIILDGKEAFVSIKSELIWCTDVILDAGKQSVSFIQKLEEPKWKERLELAAYEDKARLKGLLKQVLEMEKNLTSTSLSRHVIKKLEEMEGTCMNGAVQKSIWSTDQVELVEEVGQEQQLIREGLWASVYKVAWGGRKYAVKRFHLENNASYRAEASIATNLIHPHILRHFEYAQGPHGEALLMELMDKSLADCLKERQHGIHNVSWNLRDCVDVMLQVAEAMRYLHSHSIAHRDLKPSNILVSKGQDTNYIIAKVADFGSAKFKNTNSTSMINPDVGTKAWRAPENREGNLAWMKPSIEGHFSWQADVYSYGLVCNEILTGESPFQGEQRPLAENKFLHPNVKPKWSPPSCPPYLSALVEACRDVDPRRRPTFVDICDEIRRIKGYNLSGAYVEGSTKLLVEKDLPHNSIEPLSEHQDLGDYLNSSLISVERVLHLTSRKSDATDSLFNELQCQQLARILQNSMEEVKVRMCVDPKPSKLALVEFYRNVIACEKLVRQCRKKNWLKMAIWLVRGKESFSLRILEMIWCTAVINQGAGGRWNLVETDDAILHTGDFELQILEENARKDYMSLKKQMMIRIEQEDQNNVSTRMIFKKLDVERELFDVGSSSSAHREKVGAGTTGTVYKINLFGKSFAMKEFQKPTYPPGAERKDFKQEASTLANKNHPCIIPLIGKCEDNRSCSLIMELMTGDLYELMILRCKGQSGSPFSLHVELHIMLQIAEGMKYLHHASVAHRDLKSLNIMYNVVKDELLSKAGFIIVKVADFGMAKTKELSSGTFSPNICSPLWRAPELFNCTQSVQLHANYEKIDVFSFGIVCSEFLTGRTPYYSGLRAELGKKVQSGERPLLPGSCPKRLASLIELCWHGESSLRPTFDLICKELRCMKAMLLTGVSKDMDS